MTIALKNEITDDAISSLSHLTIPGFPASKIIDEVFSVFFTSEHYRECEEHDDIADYAFVFLRLKSILQGGSWEVEK